MNKPVFVLVWDISGPVVLELLNQDTLCPRKSILSLSSCSIVSLRLNTVLRFGGIFVHLG